MTRADSRKILISAGETSGDALGAGLVAAVRARRPEIEWVGMGGARMAEQGVRIVQDADAVAVVGILEVLGRLGDIRLAMKRLVRVIEFEQPDLFVPIDFPDFNLRLAAKASRARVPVVYFVSPQVWAWRRRRVRQIRRRIRRMLVLFPFELPLYEQAGVPVTLVGHALAEPSSIVRDAATLLSSAGLAPDRETVALVPGSRRGEVERILPALVGAAEIIARRRPEAQFLISRAPGLELALFERVLAGRALARVRVHSGDFPEILGACSVAAVASGTASLQAALAGVPFVVVYRMSAPTYWLGRALVRVEHIALPNLIAGRRVVPELVQSACVPETIAKELLDLLNDSQRAGDLRRSLAEIRERLGPPGIFERAAEALLQELDTLSPRTPRLSARPASGR